MPRRPIVHPLWRGWIEPGRAPIDDPLRGGRAVLLARAGRDGPHGCRDWWRGLRNGTLIVNLGHRDCQTAAPPPPTRGRRASAYTHTNATFAGSTGAQKTHRRAAGRACKLGFQVFFAAMWIRLPPGGPPLTSKNPLKFIRSASARGRVEPTVGPQPQAYSDRRAKGAGSSEPGATRNPSRGMAGRIDRSGCGPLRFWPTVESPASALNYYVPPHPMSYFGHGPRQPSDFCAWSATAACSRRRSPTSNF